MALTIEESGYHTLVDAALRNNPAQWFSPWRQQLLRWQEEKDKNFFGLPNLSDEIEKSSYWAEQIHQRARAMVVLGIGGSSLGGEMLVRALGGQGLPVRFVDNVDPEMLAELQSVDWRDTFLLAVSKSGGTAETLAQFLTLLPVVASHCPKDWQQRVAVIVEKEGSPLGRLAKGASIPLIAHPPVGGRFSVLSVVGLLPALVAGANVAAILQGAGKMAERCLLEDAEENPLLRMVLARYQGWQQGRGISVSMAYGERLVNVPHWMAQLEGESLGKRQRDGKSVGITPLVARGVTDQHSMLQLFLDGPADKQYTLYYDPSLAEQGEIIPDFGSDAPEVRVLAGRRVGQLFAALFMGTRDELISRGHPVRTLSIPSQDAFALGEAIVLLESEVALLGTAMGINPFDQPAVEAGKIRARNYLKLLTGQGG